MYLEKSWGFNVAQTALINRLKRSRSAFQRFTERTTKLNAHSDVLVCDLKASRDDLFDFSAVAERKSIGL